MLLGIIGFGVLGKAIYSVLKYRHNFIVYDKFLSGPQKNGAHITSTPLNLLKTELIFLCLPTPTSSEGYDLAPLQEWCQFLKQEKYQGIVVVKSTTMIGDCDQLAGPVGDPDRLDLIHNPEFLSARTATEDFRNQKQIVIGKIDGGSEESLVKLAEFYARYIPNAHTVVCRAKESEAMKVFVNNFYAMKLQIFNEFYDLCAKDELDYNQVRDMMLGNNWINPMHTEVPGHDGKLSYGGGCFPKDTEALFQYMQKRGSRRALLESCIKERNEMREG